MFHLLSERVSERNWHRCGDQGRGKTWTQEVGFTNLAIPQWMTTAVVPQDQTPAHGRESRPRHQLEPMLSAALECHKDGMRWGRWIQKAMKMLNWADFSVRTWCPGLPPLQILQRKKTREKSSDNNLEDSKWIPTLFHSISYKHVNSIE
jgi:hypothetical protein